MYIRSRRILEPAGLEIYSRIAIVPRKMWVGNRDVGGFFGRFGRFRDGLRGVGDTVCVSFVGLVAWLCGEGEVWFGLGGRGWEWGWEWGWGWGWEYIFVVVVIIGVLFSGGFLGGGEGVPAFGNKKRHVCMLIPTSYLYFGEVWGGWNESPTQKV